MKDYNSWEELLEDFRSGDVTEEYARKCLDEMSYDLTEDELEEAEDTLQEYILTLADERGYLLDFEALDSIPMGEDDESDDYNKDLWEMGFKD